jgi:hypothetical protein
MPSAFTFCAPLEPGSNVHTLFIFLGSYPLPAISLALQAAEHAKNPEIHRLVLIGPSFLDEHIKHVTASSDFRDRIPSRFSQGDDLFHFSVSSAGVITSEPARDRMGRQRYATSTFLFSSGMRSIFSRYSPILDGGRHFHFSKPSGAHSDRFIRTAELLNDPVETEFIATAIVSYLDQNVRVISCDTPSIAAIGYAAARIHERLIGARDPIEVDTFHSYRFVREKRESVRADTLYLISATASADLASDLVKLGASPKQILTLYSIGAHAPCGNVLCDLTARSPGHDNIPAIVNYDDPTACPWCREGIPIVEIRGDQFLPIQTEIQRVTPTKNDAPPWLSELINYNRGRRVFACHFGRGSFDRIYDLWIHVDKMVYENPLFQSELIKHLRQAIPANLSRIIYVGDNVSEELANLAQHCYFESTHRYVQIESIDDAGTSSAVGDCGTALVITSAVSSGRSIMDASLLLRDIQSDGKVVFIVALIRTRTRPEARRLRNSLIITPSRHYRFALHVVEEVYFPDNTRAIASSWTDEQRFLQRLLLEKTPIDSRVEAEVRQRIEILQNSLLPARGGLFDDAFWPALNSKALRIRSNFSFFGFEYGDTGLTQAEVYATVAAVFQRMRTDPAAPTRLQQMAFRRVVLDPGVFHQFNDGVVQAAVLRAAAPPELDYSLDPDTSCEMAGVLESILRNSRRPQGEACTEFLLALCLRRLRLLRRDLQPVLESHIQRAAEKSIDVELCEFLLPEIA